MLLHEIIELIEYWWEIQTQKDEINQRDSWV